MAQQVRLADASCSSTHTASVTPVPASEGSLGRHRVHKYKCKQTLIYVKQKVLKAWEGINSSVTTLT